jgi:hypothetical protein
MGNSNSGTSNKPRDLAKVRPSRIEDMDQRTNAARLPLARERQVAVDQFGGMENLSPIQASLLRRWVHCEGLLAAMEADAVAGVEIDTGRYCALVDRLHGIGKTLGLERRAKPVENLQQYMARKAAVSAPAPVSGGKVQTEPEPVRAAGDAP